MQRKLYKKEERGLKGGPNYQVSEMMGSVTSTGYWPDSPDRNNDFNIIPSNNITMEGMDMPLMGMDDLGNTQYMTPGNNYTFPGNYVTETPVAKQGGVFLGHYTFKDGGLVRMDPGGPINPNYKWYYDPNKSTAENLELNRRAELAGHNSVAEYEKSGWAWQPEKTHFTQGEGQSFRKAEPKSYNKYDYKRPSVSSVVNEAKQRAAKPDTQSYYDKHLSVQHVLDEAHRAAPAIAEKERKTREFLENRKYPNDPAGLPSVPIFESLFMAPVAAGEAGLTGLVRAAPAVGTAIWDGLGSLGSALGSELASVGSSIYEGGAALAGEVGQGFNALKNFAAPVTEAWGSAMNAPVLGNNALTGANAFKTLAAYDLSHKYIPNTIDAGQMYYETGDTKYLKDMGYNALKGGLELSSSIGPFMHEMSAAKKPVSLVDDARKMADTDKDVGSRTLSGVKTLKNTLGYMKEQGGSVFLGKFKQVGGQLVPRDISVPNLSRQDGGDMPFGLPLKEQNIYTLPEYNQPRNPKTGEILPDPRRPNLGMGTGATEYKYTYGTDEGDIDIPSIVAGQYIGDQALDRYNLTGERFKTMTDPGSYSNFYEQIGRLGLMQEKHGGSVKRVKIKSLPKNWKSQ